ncbi:MAG: site-2 protease family protein [Terriglobia bacterium]
MKWSWKIGRLAGINVYMHATFLLLILFVLFVNYSDGRDLAASLAGILFVLIIFACIVFHELGHALAARKYGVRTRDIVLLPIGGVARLERMPEKPSEELWVAIAGPLVNVAIAAALFAILFAGGVRPSWSDLRWVGGGFVEKLMVVNVWLVGFNLLPAFPMDGGRVLRALLATRIEYGRATQYAARIGQGMAVVFGIWGLVTSDFWLVFIAVFVWMGAGSEAAIAMSQRSQLTRSSLQGIPVGQVMMTGFRTVGPDDTLQQAEEGGGDGWQKDFPVVFGDRVLGMLAREDLSRVLAQRGPEARVRDAMRRDFQMADSNDMLEHALAMLQACGRRALPVQHDGRLVGLLSAESVGQLMLQPALHQDK